MLLAGDIGGTKTNLAVFSPDRGPQEPLQEATFPSADYPSLGAIAREFLQQIEWEVDRASFGVAGPVIRNRVEVTNLPWIVDAEELREELGLSSVVLLNDLASIANGVPHLNPDEVYTLKKGRIDPGGAIAVIAPGTGLGEAFLTWDGERYRPHASEGSHADFAPSDPRQMQLLRYLWPRFEHVSYEMVCSGLGIPNVYAYFKNGGYAEEPEWLADQLAQARDPTPVIVRAALEETSELCTLTLDTFVSILGAEAGNLALKVMATGGVYLGGGIPPRILPALERDLFLEAFHRKGRLGDVLMDVPVHVVLDSDIAVFGAACYGLGI
ncbi:MAG: glucokinase [Anaerolineae bacterium]|jgi:glucokinase